MQESRQSGKMELGDVITDMINDAENKMENRREIKRIGIPTRIWWKFSKARHIQKYVNTYSNVGNCVYPLFSHS